MSCPRCGGRGGFTGPFGWVRCSCTKPSEDARRAMRRINSIGTPGQLTLVESSRSASRDDKGEAR